MATTGVDEDTAKQAINFALETRLLWLMCQERVARGEFLPRNFTEFGMLSEWESRKEGRSNAAYVQMKKGEDEERERYDSNQARIFSKSRRLKKSRKHTSPTISALGITPELDAELISARLIRRRARLAAAAPPSS